MFGKISRKEKKQKYAMADHLDGKSLRCVGEKKDGIEEIVGKNGAIIRKEDTIIIYSSQDIVLRCRIEEMEAGELLSLDGVIITAPDIEHGGEIRTVIAYYSYWRELD